MSANLKSLIGRLNDTCRNALEGAAGLCLSRTNYDVDIEHLLVKLGETPDTDLHRILRQFEIDESRLAKDLVRSLDRLKTGNSRTPALSPRLPKLVEEAWLLGSIDFGASRVRSVAHPPRPPREGRIRPPRARDLQGVRGDLRRGAPKGVRRRSSRARSRTATRPRPARRRRRTRRAERTGRPRPDEGARSVHRRPHGAREGRPDRPDPRPRLRDPPGHRHPDAPPPEQPDPHRRGRRRQDRRRRGLRAAHRPGRRSRPAEERRRAHARPRAPAGRSRNQGRVREPPQVRHRRGQGLAAADHPLHRRGAHHDRRRRAGGAERRREPPEARPRARRAAHDRGDHLGRVQEVLREGRRPRAALPGRQGRGADRGGRASS